MEGQQCNAVEGHQQEKVFKKTDPPEKNQYHLSVCYIDSTFTASPFHQPIPMALVIHLCSRQSHWTPLTKIVILAY